MDVFVNSVVGAERKNGTEMDTPLASYPADDGAGDGEDQDENRSVPPSHRDGLFIFLIAQVVGFVGLEGLVVDHCMGLKCIAKIPQRSVHHVFVKQPLEK